MNKKSIIIADDHPLLLSGLHAFLKEKGFNVISEATNGLNAYNEIIKLKPDIAILDISMPKMTGLEIVKKCRKNNIKTKIILITFHKNRELYLEASKLNVAGYIFKEFALSEIENCLNQVIKNNTYFSPQISTFLNIDTQGRDKMSILTSSEKKILKLISLNLTTNEISNRLFISAKTVEKHRSNISKKLELDGKTNSLLIWSKENKNLLS